MATAQPPIDLFNPILQRIRDEFEQRYLPEDGLEGCEGDAAREYTKALKRPYVCALIADVLSGRWELGQSQQDVADRLGTQDRTWISDALRHGELSFDMFMRLRCCPTRPVDWEPDIAKIEGDMRRAGFISVARHMAGYVNDRPGLVAEQLNELNYELVCELFGAFSAWKAAQMENDESAAQEIIARVCRDSGRNVVPAWYIKRDRQQTEVEIASISSSQRSAFEYVCTVEARWQDIFVVTQCLVETLAWRQ